MQFGGASGSRSVLGSKGAEVAARLAADLGLSDSPPWHTDRSGFRRLSGWLARLLAALAKIGRDFATSSMREVAEFRAAKGDASSTKPHKSNPMTAEALQSLSAVAIACEAGLGSSAVHADDRDGAMWPVEWALMPCLFEAAGASLDHARRLLDTMVVDAAAMRTRIDTVPEVKAEAAVFALADVVGRVEGVL